ncbi:MULTISPECIES: Rv3654c family TadE-like protein [Actinomycetes]|uniref:Rv3654c family TadE-like protein n=1 Tax=Actinomycetes TaxID=1760 RepID=UPI002FCCA0A8
MKKRRSLRSEQGSGTVMATALVVVALLIAGAVLAWVAATRAAMQAASAADLSALAAADTARGLRPGDPCTVAALLAESNGALLAACTVEPDGQSVRVTTNVPVGFRAMGIELYLAEAQARAGAPPLDAPGR